MKTIQQTIVETLETLLKTIRTTNGFETDAGMKTHRGIVDFSDDDDNPSLYIIDGNEEARELHGGGFANSNFPVTIAGLTIRDGEHPYDLARTIIGEIKKAVFNYDFSLLKNLRQASYEGSAIDTDTDIFKNRGKYVTSFVFINFQVVENLKNPFIYD